MIVTKPVRAAVQDELELYVFNRNEVGLSDIRCHLGNLRPAWAPFVDERHFLSRMLCAIGWVRDGFMHTGYDRTPRYVPVKNPT